MVDSNYREVLKFIVDEMWMKCYENDQSIREISDLREDGGIYSMEKALIKLLAWKLSYRFHNAMLSLLRQPIDIITKRAHTFSRILPV